MTLGNLIINIIKKLNAYDIFGVPVYLVDPDISEDIEYISFYTQNGNMQDIENLGD